MEPHAAVAEQRTIAPHDPRPKRPVADTLLQIVTTRGVGSAVQACEALKRSLELNPQNTNAVEMLRKLEQR